MSKIISVAVVMIACGLQTLGAQEQERKPKVVIFHVTSVERVDNSAACKGDACSGISYKVEGYADGEFNSAATHYVITCEEQYSDRPFLHRNNICARFHSGSAYTALLLSSTISFPHSGLNKDFETDYSILSEKEIARGPEQQTAKSGSDAREVPNSAPVREPARDTEQMARKSNN